MSISSSMINSFLNTLEFQLEYPLEEVIDQVIAEFGVCQLNRPEVRQALLVAMHSDCDICRTADHLLFANPTWKLIERPAGDGKKITVLVPRLPKEVMRFIREFNTTASSARTRLREQIGDIESIAALEVELQRL